MCQTPHSTDIHMTQGWVLLWWNHERSMHRQRMTPPVVVGSTKHHGEETMTYTRWHGTRFEELDLLAVVRRHCTCEVDEDGVRLSVCPPHRMLLEDQRALDGLLFARRLARRLQAEERCAA
jgi:hypothetical protein